MAEELVDPRAVEDTVEPDVSPAEAEIVAPDGKRAIKWLEGVQAGKIIPDLPLATDEDGTPTGDLLIFGSQKQLRHNW